MTPWRSDLEHAFDRLIAHAETQHQRPKEGDLIEIPSSLWETPGRAARAWEELTCGYREAADLKYFRAEGKGIVTQRVTFNSTCEHHLLPFFGTVDYAYIPDERQIGLSKFARLTKVYSRRLQVQERLTAQLTDALVGALEPTGVLVVTRAMHSCMSMRGVQEVGAVTTISEARGVLLESAQSKAEAMQLMGMT